MINFRLTAISGAMLLMAACSSFSEQTSLKEAYSDSFMIGCAVNPLHTSGRLAQANKLLFKHFNAISPENCLKAEVVQPRPGVWDFRQADEFVQFGEDHDMWMLGHTLVWHNQTPAFYWENKDGSPKTREELIETMREHIETVAGRYAGRIDACSMGRISSSFFTTSGVTVSVSSGFSASFTAMMRQSVSMCFLSPRTPASIV